MVFASTPSPKPRNTSQGAKRVNRPRQPHTDLASPDEEPTNPRPTPASEGVGSGDADPHPEWRQDVAEASPHNPKEGTDGRQRPAPVKGAQIRAPAPVPGERRWRPAGTEDVGRCGGNAPSRRRSSRRRPAPPGAHGAAAPDDKAHPARKAQIRGMGRWIRRTVAGCRRTAAGPQRKTTT
ncbi:translation initiation factor IF-2-like [Panicum virgatum]|uniref:translation initiation factor IF-2-like n=1 Tax=Panicum virgatum TaxID=38727 RepID=UPI0019D59A37|nr:translation initiation factor IF-2-like [Panicum virgatum]